VDVLGIVVEANMASEIMTKKQQPLIKRDISIMDQTGVMVKLTSQNCTTGIE
jgi:hypothetical protein